MFWLSLILFGCMAIVTTVTVMWLRAQKDRKNIAPLFAPADSNTALNLTDFPLPTELEILTIIKGAIQARDAETLRDFVHDNPEASTADMLEFFAATQERDGKLDNHQWIGASDTDMLQIQSIVLSFKQDGHINYRLAMLVPDESGDWRLDFPSYARWCTPPIQQLGEPGGHPGGRVRVNVLRDNYFNGPFSNDREWACFAIKSPDSKTSGYAYCRIGSPEHEFLEKTLNQAGRQARVILDIDRVEDAQTRQFIITNVVCQDWLIADPYVVSE